MIAGKSQPPRIYLDQNAWINLAKAHYGRDNSVRFDEALRVLVDAANSDRVRVPLSFNHLIEVCASGDMERRKRLGNFMLQVSKQYAIAPASLIWDTEAFDAVNRRLLGPDAPQVLKYDALVQRGLWCALGMTPRLEGGTEDERARLEEALRSNETALRMMTEWMSGDEGRRVREQSERDAEIFERVRQQQLGAMSTEQKRRADTLQVARELLLPIADAECRKIGVDPVKFRDTLRSDDDEIAFAHDLPSFDVMLSLGLARDEEVQRRVDRNDLRDIGFLAAAIPYCDVAVVERYFGNLAIRIGLDKKYQCTLLTDVAELPRLLS